MAPFKCIHYSLLLLSGALPGNEDTLCIAHYVTNDWNFFDKFTRNEGTISTQTPKANDAFLQSDMINDVGARFEILPLILLLLVIRAKPLGIVNIDVPDNWDGSLS